MANPLRVILTIAGLSPEYGGPSRSTVALATELGRLGLRVELAACDESSGIQKPLLPPSALVSTHLLPAACRRTQCIARRNGFFRLIQSLRDDSIPTIVHDTGLWLPNNHASATAARRFGLPLVLSPRGMLAQWSLKHRVLKKRIAWVLYQRRDLLAAKLVHATSQAEASEIRALGTGQQLAVIPNGIEAPGDANGKSSRNTDMIKRRAGEHTVLFLSRLHPKKGLLELVEAWAALRPHGWRVIVGGDGESAYRSKVEEAVRGRELAGHFDFLGEVRDERKWELYRNSDLFVLPSKSENFGLVIAEALACGVPVITTRNTPWNELVGHRCGWWVEDGPGPLVQALREAMAMEEGERREMGARGASLIKSNYTWRSVAKQMNSAYEEIRQSANQ